MARFLVSPESVKKDRIAIRGREVHHLKKVLRLKKGEGVVCFDGSGKEYKGIIVSLSPGQAEIKIEKSKKFKREPSLKITLAPSLIRTSKMDLIVQKCTELGFYKLMPMRTERCLIKLDDLKIQARQERWQRLAEEAAKQSGRVQVPRIEVVKDFASILQKAKKFDLGIIFWEEEDKEKSLKKALTQRDSSPQEILILIGPEGGFTTQEAVEAKKAGLLSVSLGPHILRAETAAIITVAILAYEWGR